MTFDSLLELLDFEVRCSLRHQHIREVDLKVLSSIDVNTGKKMF